MNDEGIQVLTDALSSFNKVATKFKVDELHPIATAAIRQSNNQQDIIKKLKDTGVEIKIVPEEDEAFYGYYAISHTTDIENVSPSISGADLQRSLYLKIKIKGCK